MKPSRSFEEYVKRKVLRKKFPDVNRAKSLLEVSSASFEDLFERIKLMGLTPRNVNSIITSAYEVLMEGLRARLLLEGYSASGNGAHEAEVASLLKFGFSYSHVSFLNGLRNFRNGIFYYGKTFDLDYASKVLSFLNEVYPKLKKEIENATKN